ncbi:MAG: hypothetical protein ACYTGL_17790 [Planctomycetota bacterium]|jgi:hypothetical protein
MSQAVETYLDRVMQCAAISDPTAAERLCAEQRDHLEEKIDRLKQQGVPAEDAVFQAIDEHGDPVTVGYGLRPRLPLIDVRARGTARGIIAIGPKAVGVFAFGGMACGVFAFGGLACGVFTVGGLTAALLFSWAGMAIVPLGVAYAGFAAAPVAIGGFAAGLVAAGGFAAGMYAIGGMSASHYTADTAPDWMTSAAAMTPHVVESLAFHVTCAVLMIALLTFSNLASFRELRRVQKISPRSV